MCRRDADCHWQDFPSLSAWARFSILMTATMETYISYVAGFTGHWSEDFHHCAVAQYVKV